MLKRLAVFAAILALGACAQYESQRGVDVTWDPSTLNQFQVGETTRQQILKTLGPPSQIIAMEKESALYYLYERSKGDGLILLVYNRFERNTTYDRAVFFFDEQDRLTDYASRIHHAQ